jgi:branched-chain amino acid aminotransferase
MIANENFLGVRAAQRAAYYVILSPAGSYFGHGMQPVSIWLSTDYSRAGRGGTGEAKCGGNYASSLVPQQEGAANGCSQVLFLDAQEHKYIEELGGMNIFLVRKDGTLLTPELSGSILRGVTRDSILRLAGVMGMKVEERRIAIDEWREGVDSGDISEVFACGTAAVVAPVNVLKGKGFSCGDPQAPAGQVTLALHKTLTDIQYGRAQDKHGWMKRLA